MLAAQNFSTKSVRDLSKYGCNLSLRDQWNESVEDLGASDSTKQGLALGLSEWILEQQQLLPVVVSNVISFLE